MDKAVEDAEITEVSTNDNVEDVVERPEDESTDVDTAAAETFDNEPTSPESDESKQTKAVAVDHEIDGKAYLSHPMLVCTAASPSSCLAVK